MAAQTDCCARPHNNVSGRRPRRDAHLAQSKSAESMPDTLASGDSEASAAFIAYRLASETFLRGVDLLNEAVGGNIAHGMLLVALWTLELRRTAPGDSLVLTAEWKPAMNLHELARALGRPYSTVYRQLGQMAKDGIVTRGPGGAAAVSRAFLAGPAGTTFRGRSIASYLRLVVNLNRIGCLSGSAAILERDLSPEQEEVVLRAGLEVLLKCLLLTSRFYDDLVSGLVFKLVATSNIKHLTSQPDVARGPPACIPDDLRRPITVYNAARALHMPYETTRRIAKQFLAKKMFLQAGDGGLIVPSEVHRRTENPHAQSTDILALAASIAQLDSAGLKLRLRLP